MKLSRVLGAVVAAAGLLAGTVYAKEEIQIMQTITNQKQLEIYAKAPELPETVSDFPFSGFSFSFLSALWKKDFFPESFC